MKSKNQCQPCYDEKRRKKYAREKGAVYPTVPSHLFFCGLCYIHKKVDGEMYSNNRCRDCIREQCRRRARKRTKEQRQAERRRVYERQGKLYRTRDELKQWTKFKRETHAIIKRLRAVYKPKKVRRSVKYPGMTTAEIYKHRYHNDPEFNLKERLRAHHRRMNRRGYRVGDMFRTAIKTNGRTPTAEAFTGYSVGQLKKHLEKQFTKGMNWQRFMSGEIHIDHIIPLSSFDRTNEDEVRAAWQLSNLRPLWAEDNRRKAAKHEGRLL